MDLDNMTLPLDFMDEESSTDLRPALETGSADCGPAGLGASLRSGAG
jgi:hypothetical protein